MTEPRPLSGPQKAVLGLAFVPMLATGIAGGYGTYTNIAAKYGSGTATGAVAAGEGATAVLALVLLGLTMLGQSSPLVIRIGLWALPAAASAMAATAATDTGQLVIYAVTPMGMTVAAEGMAFLARRIVVHRDGHNAEAETRAAALVRELAYHRARAANHPDAKTQKASVRASWKLARKIGTGDTELGTQLLTIQRTRVTEGADMALDGMFGTTVTPAVTPVTPPVTPVTAAVTPPVMPQTERPEIEAAPTPAHDTDTQVSSLDPERVTGPDESVTPQESGPSPEPSPESGAEETESAVTLAEVAAVAGVPLPEPGDALTDDQAIVVLRHLRYSADPPLSYRQAAAAYRVGGFIGSEARLRTSWTALMTQEENAS